jgi:hypothetical protein
MNKTYRAPQMSKIISLNKSFLSTKVNQNDKPKIIAISGAAN